MIFFIKVLLIDDDENFCFFVQQNLNKTGFLQLEYATHPDKGIKLAKKKMPDAILLDIIMPGKNGFEVLKILKNDPKTFSIPIIMLTAIETDEAQLTAVGLYAEDYLMKPVSSETLKNKIKEVFIRRSAMER